MRLLLDTHVLLALTQQTLEGRSPEFVALLGKREAEAYASVASLWEIAIKTRLGKLDPGMELDRLAAHFQATGISILPIDQQHAVACVEPEPMTRDPFDRMLLAQCAVENLRLVTVDRGLIEHPLAWRPE